MNCFENELSNVSLLVVHCAEIRKSGSFWLTHLVKTQALNHPVSYKDRGCRVQFVHELSILLAHDSKSTDVVLLTVNIFVILFYSLK